MDKIEIINIAKEFAEVVRGSFQVRKVVLYGSQANGNAQIHSDIDIAVIVNDFKDDFLDSEAKLYRLGSKIDLRIEPLLLDESSDPSGFIQHILQEGQVIYSQD